MDEANLFFENTFLETCFPKKKKSVNIYQFAHMQFFLGLHYVAAYHQRTWP